MKLTAKGIEMDEWKRKYPLIEELVATREVFWANPLYGNRVGKSLKSLGMVDIDDAEARLDRFAPLIKKLFPETEKANGIIESPLEVIQQHAADLKRRMRDSDSWGSICKV
ncbi:MAG: D-serine ammonia-lyase [Firmicutes bacterium]|nr:D-serine ammonia-lyase [Bacillota bacterium]